MAATPQFIATARTAFSKFVNADGTGIKTLLIIGANGGLIEALLLTSNDTTARNVTLLLGNGTTDVLVDTVTIPAATAPEIIWQFTTPVKPARTIAYQNLAGGFGGMATYRVDYSLDGSGWTTVIAVAYNAQYAFAGNLVAAPWRRIVGLTRGAYEWAVCEVSLDAVKPFVTRVVFPTAPVAGTRVYATYRMYGK